MEIKIFNNLPDKYKKLLPYLLVFISFSVAIVLLVILIDSVIMPALILDRGTIKVPNVTGMSYERAREILESKNLVINKVTEQYSESVPKGKVMMQTPKAYQMVKEGRSIYLTVSKGQETVVAPYLIGLPSREARVQLMNKGLNFGNVEYTYSDIYGNDTIIQQRILSGQPLPFGSTIDVVVSKGPEQQVFVPNLEGSDLGEVKSILDESGLVTGNIEFVDSDTFMPFTVINQDPKRGTLLPKGAKVNIWVVRQPQP